MTVGEILQNYLSRERSPQLQNGNSFRIVLPVRRSLLGGGIGPFLARGLPVETVPPRSAVRSLKPVFIAHPAAEATPSRSLYLVANPASTPCSCSKQFIHDQEYQTQYLPAIELELF